MEKKSCDCQFVIEASAKCPYVVPWIERTGSSSEFKPLGAQYFKRAENAFFVFFKGIFGVLAPGCGAKGL